MKDWKPVKSWGRQYYIALCSHNIACVYQKMKQFQEMIPFAQNSLAIAIELKTPLLIRENAKILSELHEELGNYKKALTYSRQYRTLQIKELENKSGKEFAFMQTRFESSQKDQEILQLESDKKAGAYRKSLLQVCVGFLLALGFLIYNRQRKIIQKKKLLVELEKKDVLSTGIRTE